MLPLIWYVAAGSAAGGVARFLLTTAIQQRIATSFPMGTLAVNVTGSIALGFVMRYALGSPGLTPEMRVMLTTGFLGGYTTFSAFSYEAIALLERGEHGKAATYVLASVGLALVGTVVGMMLANVALGPGGTSPRG